MTGVSLSRRHGARGGVAMIAAAAAALLLATVAAAAGPGAAQQVAAAAAAAYDAGVDHLATDRAAATARFQEAAALWRSLAEEHGLWSGPLWYNVGNASLLAGDVGRAILAYRRAERLMPFDRDLAANLAAARERLGVGAPPPPQPGALHGVVEVSRVLTPRARMQAFAGLAGCAWALALARLLVPAPGRMRPARWLVAAAAVGAAVVLGTLVLEAALDRADRRGVVVAAAGAPTRTGPGDAVHDAASPALLPAGTEVRVLEKVAEPGGGGGAWAMVRLGNGADVWVRAEQIETVTVR
jgi:hypothetical protein